MTRTHLQKLMAAELVSQHTAKELAELVVSHLFGVADADREENLELLKMEAVMSNVHDLSRGIPTKYTEDPNWGDFQSEVSMTLEDDATPFDMVAKFVEYKAAACPVPAPLM